MTEELSSKQKELIIQLFAYINQGIDQGVSEESIAKSLVENGMTQEKAEVVIESAKKRRQNEKAFIASKFLDTDRRYSDPQMVERSRKGLGKMIFGGLLFLAGGIVTLVSYSEASGGGSYVLWYGALIVGGLNFFIGLSQWHS